MLKICLSGSSFPRCRPVTIACASRSPLGRVLELIAIRAVVPWVNVTTNTTGSFRLPLMLTVLRSELVNQHKRSISPTVITELDHCLTAFDTECLLSELGRRSVGRPSL